MAKRTRVTVDLSESDYSRLCAIQQKYDVKKADIFRNSLRLLEYLAESVDNDWDIVLKKNSKEKYITMFMKNFSKFF